MSSHQPDESLRVQAKRQRRQKEAEARRRQTAQAQLSHRQRAIEALNSAIQAMRCAPDPFDPKATAKRLRGHCKKVTSLLAEVLVAIRSAGLLCKWAQLDEPATLAYCRQERDDPEESQLAFACAKQMIETAPTDRKRLTKLVCDAALEPGLRKAWDWLSILLSGLNGQQWLVWKQQGSESPTSTLAQPNATSETIARDVQTTTAGAATVGEWSAFDNVGQWARLFGVGRNTMGKMLKAQQVHNLRLSRKCYRIAIADLPAAPPPAPHHANRS